jgi:lysyl-tRNA synthetase class 2
MKVIVDKEILKRHPKLNIGIVSAKDVDNTGDDEKIYHLLEEVEKLIEMNMSSEKLAEHPLISPWRAAYSDFGSKPSKYRNSVEALVKTVLKGKKIHRISKLVDLYNYLSLKHLVPMGADDLDKIEGDIKLTFAKGTEKFTPLGRTEAEKPDKGEVIYRDDKKVLCRKWNWRECDESKITENTKKLVIYIEGLFPVTKEKLKEVCKETADLIKTFCNGKAEYFILDEKNNQVKL